MRHTYTVYCYLACFCQSDLTVPSGKHTDIGTGSCDAPGFQISPDQQNDKCFKVKQLTAHSNYYTSMQ